MPKKILVVDDEADVRRLTRRILERNGFLVVEASNGDAAIRKADTESPHLILLDIVMPGKDGIEVCKILKSQDKTKQIPIVMFTVLGRDLDKKRSANAGCDGYVTRPFEAEDLLTEVKKHVQ